MTTAISARAASTSSRFVATKAERPRSVTRRARAHDAVRGDIEKPAEHQRQRKSEHGCDQQNIDRRIRQPPRREKQVRHLHDQPRADHVKSRSPEHAPAAQFAQPLRQCVSRPCHGVIPGLPVQSFSSPLRIDQTKYGVPACSFKWQSALQPQAVTAPYWAKAGRVTRSRSIRDQHAPHRARR